MVKYKNAVLIVLMLFFLLFSLYPSVFEISRSSSLPSKGRQFILEHNYYWPDFNLYLSKIRQGYENRWLAVEKYTSESHRGSLVQIFYLYLGRAGSLLNISPNHAYQAGRLILSPLLLIVILMLTTAYFRSGIWQIIAFLTVLVSGSFPRLQTVNGRLTMGRFMEWWSNTDPLQRITFIPHILFGQVISFYLLYQLTVSPSLFTPARLVFYAVLANLAGLVFPPSLMTLLGVIASLTFIRYIKTSKIDLNNIFLILFSSPSLVYLFVVTKQLPWSALVQFHRTHPMMVPLDQYILGTGPVIFLGLFGSILAITGRQRKFYPLILWVVVTFLFAAVFSVIKEQSPLRFTQTGLFIPLGILSAYFFRRVYRIINPKIFWFLMSIYFLTGIAVMKNSLDWQLSFISQRLKADIPAVPYPPQTLYPLNDWMDAIVWLRENTSGTSVVLAEFSAGNFIPAYAGNFVYFGQSNTVDYERKALEVDRFFRGQMTPTQAEIFLKNGRIKYVFSGPQETEKLAGKKLEELYPFLKLSFTNPQVRIYLFLSL